jgi:hypothetical protein
MAKNRKKRPSIDVKHVLNMLKSRFSQLKSFFSGLGSVPNSKRYFIAAPILVLFFIITTFPLDVFIIKELKSMEGIYFKSIKTEDLSISPFSDWSAKSVLITTVQKSDIGFSDIDVSLGTFSLFSKKISGDFTIGNFSFITEDVQMTSVVSAESDVALDAMNLPLNGSFSLTLSNASIKGLTLQGFKIPPIQIPKANLKAAFTGKTMTIKDCSITGKDLSGTIKGSITLDKIMSRSQLNITIEIDSTSNMLADYKPLLGSFINQSTGRLSISVQGTAGTPSVNIVSQGGTSPVAPSFKR